MKFKTIEMKKIMHKRYSFFLSFSLMIFFSFNSKIYGQLSNQIPEPELQNVVYYYDKQKNTLVSLERTEAQLKSKVKVSGGALVYQVQGKTSPVKVSQNDYLSFIVNTSASHADLSPLFPLFKADVKNNKRETETYKSNLVGKDVKPSGVVKYDVKNIGNSLYQIIPREKLGKGEYIFIYYISTAAYIGVNIVDAYCFSVE